MINTEMKETDRVIRARRTVKVLGKETAPFPADDSLGELLGEMLETAGFAPFHYACHKAHRSSGKPASIVPWRFYVLPTGECRKLLQWILDKKLEAGKISQMLATADALVLSTWLPDLKEGDHHNTFEPTQRNVEHIAAASAAIQNFLLAATAREIGNYWSSGGLLREEAVYRLLNIPQEEQLLGAIFLFPRETGDAEVVSGKLNELRGEAPGWSRWISIGQ